MQLLLRLGFEQSDIRMPEEVRFGSSSRDLSIPLDAPLGRVGALDTWAARVENGILPRVKDITEEALAILTY